MRLLLYIFILYIGGCVACKEKAHRRFFEKLMSIQQFCLLLLLFIMGINLGIHKEVIHAFYELSYKAFVLSIFSIMFSIAGVKIISKRIIIENKGDHKNGY